MRSFYIKIFFFLPIICNICIAQVIQIRDENSIVSVKNQASFLEDKDDCLALKDILNTGKFQPITSNIPNFGVSSSAFWLKLQIQNNTTASKYILEIAQPGLDEIELYQFSSPDKLIASKSGEIIPFANRELKDANYLFKVNLTPNQISSLYIKVKARDNIQAPMFISSLQSISETTKIRDFFVGLYLGVMLVMILYNSFLYFTIGDKGYLYYVVYILAVLLTQASIQGYTYEYLWPGSPLLARSSSFIFPPWSGIAGLYMMRNFLSTPKFLPKLNQVYILLVLLYLVSFILFLAGFYQLSFVLIEVTATIVSLFMLVVAILIRKKGYRPAQYFLLAWSCFLIGISIYVMKDIGILQYNTFTYYLMPIGSAFEVVLLSFALADRINTLKKDKEESQLLSLKTLEENKKLITEQNIILEQKVFERTNELTRTNESLNSTLTDLRETQTQLFNAEKMASLGQLTAGIAHEINNPINFVSANLKPLKMDYADIMHLVKKYEAIQPNENLAEKLKEIELFRKEIDLEYIQKEIELLLNGIEDGAKRTAEIVSGLKSFSRLDDAELKEVNINEGIESTLTLLKHAIQKNTEVVLDLATLPLIECFPGKLNQVFMNILSNAIYAINHKKSTEKNRLVIRSFIRDNQIGVSFEDTGIGMSAEVKNKIFEPFYTTKDVGEGTGLGMSIVFKIMESHQAKIEIESELGKGTKITLLFNQTILKPLNP